MAITIWWNCFSQGEPIFTLSMVEDPCYTMRLPTEMLWNSCYFVVQIRMVKTKSVIRHYTQQSCSGRKSPE